MKNYIIYTSWIVMLYAFYIWVTYDYIESSRLNLVSAMEEKSKTLGGNINEVKEQLEKLEYELKKAEDCIELNSNTWSYIDCETYYNKSVSSSWVTYDQETKPITKYNKLNNHICQATKNSPLCNNIKLVKELEIISKNRGVDFMLMLGITYAESNIWTNYAKGCSSEYYNMWGIKWRINNDWSKTKDQKIPDKNGCWIYKFKSYEDYWQSKANSLYYGYITKGCINIECISKRYVKWDWLYKPAYNDRVNTFAKYNFN